MTSYILGRPITFGDMEQIAQMRVLFEINSIINTAKFKETMEDTAYILSKHTVPDYYHEAYILVTNVVHDLNNFEGPLEGFITSLNILESYNAKVQQ